ncbi:MAG TPA: hypothetical protein VMR54_14850 [Thermoanaerobaculia bacterium]|nr:hypothetical protein [Thermoanaerobaculia bacterium]
MNESDVPIASSQTSSATTDSRPGRRVAARRKSAPRPKTARRATPSTKRKGTARSGPAAARRGADLRGILQTLANKAAGARGRLAAASGESARATRRTWQRVSGVSRKTIDRLLTEWKQMDAAKKTQFIAALLTALAAASAPIVRRSMKKR